MTALFGKNTDKLHYCYKIILRTGKILHLTSSSTTIVFKGENYLPKSGLFVQKINFDDSPIVIAELHGIFEKEGIELGQILEDLKIEIMILTNDKPIKQLVTLYCNKVVYIKNAFKLYLSSIGENLLRIITKNYSESCRAELGDCYCKFKLSKHLNKVKLDKCLGNKIWLKNYVNILENFQWIAKLHNFSSIVIKQKRGLLELERSIPTDLLNCEFVELIPYCDKKFNSCCSIFNNAINFRGEPFIKDLRHFINSE